MNYRGFLIGFLVCITLIGCQRFERHEKRTGLDNDSHSYSYVSYPENKMKIAAMNVKGVNACRIRFDGKKLYVYVVPKERIQPKQYGLLAKQVRKEVAIAAPLNPFHVKVVKK